MLDLNMLDVKKINLVNMERNELLELAKQEYSKFEHIKDLPFGDTIRERRGLEAIGKSLQRYSFNDEEVFTVKNSIENILLSDFERQRLDLENQRKSMSRTDMSNDRMSNKKLYTNRYRK